MIENTGYTPGRNEPLRSLSDIQESQAIRREAKMYRQLEQSSLPPCGPPGAPPAVESDSWIQEIIANGLGLKQEPTE